jgi:hypothetical protein
MDPSSGSAGTPLSATWLPVLPKPPSLTLTLAWIPGDSSETDVSAYV